MNQENPISSADDESTTRSTEYSRRVIVMTRIPEAGRVKTRLIPAMGADGAAAIHAALLRRTLRITEQHAGQGRVDVEIRFTGGTPESILSYDPARSAVWQEQQGNDLGERMHHAIEAALKDGAPAVIVIGTDCPDLSPDLLDRAWRTLQICDVVLGPAADGGYYLIGMKEPDSRLFTGVHWGTERVLQQTENRCRESRKSLRLLPMLSDVDEAEDLVLCRRFEHEFADCLPRKCAGLFSIVIPTLNEIGQLEKTLKPFLSHADCEVIIADGGSTDGTIDLATKLGCRVIKANRGRGRQMNAGAAIARGEFLLFLHADTCVPDTFREDIRNTLKTGAIAGAFRFQVDQPGWGLRCVEWGTNLRARFLQRPYGDQTLFLQSDDFYRLGGFRNWPLMEDVEICRRLRQDGRIRIASTAIRTSARRWMRLGVIRTTLINQLLVAGFRLGISPQRLAGWYSAPSGGSFDRLRRVCSVRSLLAVGVLLFVIGFVDRQSQDSQSWSDVARNRDTLEQMMEQNRRAFPEADEVDMETILDMMRRETCVLVDVRTDAERRISIIPGAISAAEYEQNITEHSGRTVVCYCTIGYRSAHYAQQMKRQGVLVKSFNGSIIAWCQAGRILTTEDGRKTTRVHVYGSKWDLVPPEYQSVR